MKFRASLLCLVLMAACTDGEFHRGDYCSEEGHTTLLLVDRTSEYDDLDREIFAQGLERIYATVEIGDRLVVQTITDEYAASERVFDRCRPGCPPGTTGLFGACRPMVAENARRAFRSDYVEAAQGILSGSAERPRSEVVMTLSTQVAALRQARVNRVYVFSDLLENSTTFPWPSIIRTEPGAFVEQARAIGGIPALSGVDVGVFGFGRDHTAARHSLSPQARQQLSAAWTAYFTESQSNSLSLDQRLP